VRRQLEGLLSERALRDPTLRADQAQAEILALEVALAARLEDPALNRREVERERTPTH
jgi:hypothetical protein